jgi:pimeloyl-ACP methyl ester carboxylesterase
VCDRPGISPAIVALHGFPDDSRIYNRLIGPLAPQRVVTFDWMGYGRSSRRDSAKLTAADRQREILAVLDDVGLDQVVLVGHDAAGPEAIDFAVTHPERVARLVLLNTYYGRSRNLRLPEMIALMADPALAPLTDALLDDPDHRLWLLAYAARRFGLDENLPADGIGEMRSSRNFSETPASPMRWPKSERGPPRFRAPSTGRTAQSLPAGCRPPSCRSQSSSAETTRTWIRMWHSTSAACSRTQNCTCSSKPPTGPSGIDPTRSQI